MTFSRVNPLGWALFELLTSAQMNELDTDVSNALDGADGGLYTPSDTLELDGSANAHIALPTLKIRPTQSGPALIAMHEGSRAAIVATPDGDYSQTLIGTQAPATYTKGLPGNASLPGGQANVAFGGDQFALALQPAGEAHYGEGGRAFYIGGDGARYYGGISDGNKGGRGVFAQGASGVFGGEGVVAFGGPGQGSTGAAGVYGLGNRNAPGVEGHGGTGSNAPGGYFQGGDAGAGLIALPGRLAADFSPISMISKGWITMGFGVSEVRANPPASTPLSNLLVAKLLPKAWGIIYNGALYDGANIEAVDMLASNFVLRVTLAAPMEDPIGYTVFPVGTGGFAANSPRFPFVLRGGSTPAAPDSAFVRTTTQFYMRQQSTAGTGLAWTDSEVYFVVFGHQLVTAG